MAGQQQQQSSDSGMGPFWVIVLMFLVGYVVWREAHQYIVNFVFFINIWEAKLIHLFTGSSLLQSEINVMQNINPISVDWNALAELTRSVGTYFHTVSLAKFLGNIGLI